MAVNRARWRNLGDVMMNLSPSLESESVTTWTLTQLNRDDVARTNTRHFGKSKDILNTKTRAFIVQAPLTQRTEPANESISWLYLLLFSKNQSKSLLNYPLSQADENVWYYDLRSTIVEMSTDTRKITYATSQKLQRRLLTLSSSTYVLRYLSKYCPVWGNSGAYNDVLWNSLPIPFLRSDFVGCSCCTLFTGMFTIKKIAVRTTKILKWRQWCNPEFKSRWLLTLPCL